MILISDKERQLLNSVEKMAGSDSLETNAIMEIIREKIELKTELENIKKDDLKPIIKVGGERSTPPPKPPKGTQHMCCCVRF